MCVIIIQPAGEYLDKEEAKRAWTRNPDGGGFAYINHDEEIVVKKSMEFNEFWQQFERARSDHRDKDFLVHMRIATHGSVCLDNVHPFQVDKYTVMAHNGIIHGVPSTDPEGLDRSDSRMFIDYVLPDLPEDWLDKEYLVDMVQDWIGWSRLVFLTTNPKLQYNIYVLNQKKGEWKNKLWYSNTNHFPPKTYSHTAPKPFEKTETKTYTPNNTGYVSVNGVLVPENEFYEDWWAARTEELERQGTFDDDTSKLDAALTKASITDIRVMQHGLTWPILIAENDILCTGCDSALKDDNDYDCECYALACESCYHLAEFCGCDDTWRRLQLVEDFSVPDQRRIEHMAALDTGDVHGTTGPN